MRASPTRRMASSTKHTTRLRGGRTLAVGRQVPEREERKGPRMHETHQGRVSGWVGERVGRRRPEELLPWGPRLTKAWGVGRRLLPTIYFKGVLFQAQLVTWFLKQVFHLKGGRQCPGLQSPE